MRGILLIVKMLFLIIAWFATLALTVSYWQRSGYTYVNGRHFDADLCVIYHEQAIDAIGMIWIPLSLLIIIFTWLFIKGLKKKAAHIRRIQGDQA